jgi:uncharacterized protein with FMN-binding domain
MTKAPWLMVAGAVAGFLGVLGSHKPATPASGATPGAAGGRPSSPSAGSAGSGSATGPVTATGPAATVTGPAEQYGYGELAVRVTIRGSRITGLTVPLIRTAEPFSQQLASQAIPVLRNEVLSAQGTNINAVSGATYTSQAYATSVQAALDQLHFK